MRRNKKAVTFLVTFALFISICTVVVYAVNSYTRTTATASYQFRNLPVDKAVQSFYMASDSEIYVTQRDGTNTILSRCISLNLGEDAKYRYCVDYAVLTNYGHGESLEVDTSVSGNTYIWVGNGATSVSPYFSTTISRIKYTKTSNTTTTPVLTTVSDKRTLTNMHYATGNGAILESGTTAARVSVAIADGSDRIGFRIVLSNDNYYYSVYDLSDVNAYLTGSVAVDGSAQISNTTLRTYCKSTFLCTVNPNNSYQGHDMVGVGTDNKFIYHAGGNAGENPKISRMLYTNNPSGTYRGGYTYQSVTEVTATGCAGYEVEQVRIWNDYCYFAVNTAVDEANSTIVYRIPVPAA